jgi:DNA topoisomerase-2
MVMDGDIIINKRNKEMIENDLNKNNFDKIDDSFNYLLNMAISSFTKEKLQDLNDESSKMKEKIQKLESIEEKDLWINELMELKNKLK